METKLYFDKIPKEFKATYLGHGENGTCYRIGDTNKVYKEIGDISDIEKDYLFLLSQNSDIFVFPDQLVYLKKGDLNQLYGYTMEYIPGVPLGNIPQQCELESLFTELKKVEKEIKSFSERYIAVADFHFDNVFYQDNGKIRVIDTDLYHGYYDGELGDLISVNLIDYNACILNLFRELSQITFTSQSLDDYYRLCYCRGKMYASDFLRELKNYLEIELKEKINTYGEMKKSLSLVKRN